ncbi:transporter substrate-binding domain-containing protein [Paenibacillus sp. FSL K6-1096]|uniref:transporter substrate-binding domain-containing protein n=1 Tax=Paenibacillus sp. FSL K6-1096 TaxID=2921460 RepID=UPI0030EBC88A
MVFHLKGIKSLAVITILTSLLAGCGNAADNTSAANPAGSPSPGNNTAASGGLVDKVKADGKIKVGTDATYAPFEFVEDGKIVGYGAEILAEVVKELGVKLEQPDTPFTGILPGLDAGKFDIVATSMTITPKRQENYLFTVPIAEGTAAVMKHKGDDSIQTVDDLNGKIVGVLINSGPVDALKKYNEKLKADGGGFKEMKEYVSYPDAYQDLAAKRVDAVVQALPAMSQLVKSRPDTFEIVGTIGDPTYLAWMVRKGDTDMQQYLNRVIIGMKENGKLAEMQKQWFGFEMKVPDEMYSIQE